MCGRISFATPLPVVEERFDADAVEPIAPRYNIAPGDALATIPNDRCGEIDQFQWGLVPPWIEDPTDWPAPINARAETVADKPAFRDAFESRRCLVLADGFYEWQGEQGRKQPYRIRRADGDPFALAGLWERRDVDDDPLETVTAITTDANGVVGPIHDRMPVMLEPDELDPWLAGEDPEALRDLLDPFPEELTEVYPVSTAVNDPANDSPAVAEPLGTEQAGFEEFGSLPE